MRCEPRLLVSQRTICGRLRRWDGALIIAAYAVYVL